MLVKAAPGKNISVNLDTHIHSKRLLVQLCQWTSLTDETSVEIIAMTQESWCLKSPATIPFVQQLVDKNE